MSGWDGQSKGSILGYKIFIFILKYVHIRVAYFLLYFVAAHFYFFTPKKNIRHFYRQIIRFSRIKTEFSIFRNYINLGKVLIDRVAVFAGFSNKFSFEFEGEEYLNQMAVAGKGGIIIGAHAGNWEIAGYLLKRINKPVHVLMYDGERSNVKDLMETVSGGENYKTIYIHNNNLDHIYKIGEVLKNGELIAMHGDRFITGSKVHSCSFLGYPAYFPLGPYYLASMFNVPVCFVATMKESNNHYHFFASPAVYSLSDNKNNKKQKINNMAEQYAIELEKMVKRYPLQWFNYYDFWNTK
jgi:predicted LPLAT superfamily acyltransferase